MIAAVDRRHCGSWVPAAPSRRSMVDDVRQLINLLPGPWGQGLRRRGLFFRVGPVHLGVRRSPLRDLGWALVRRAARMVSAWSAPPLYEALVRVGQRPGIGVSASMGDCGDSWQWPRRSHGTPRRRRRSSTPGARVGRERRGWCRGPAGSRLSVPGLLTTAHSPPPSLFFAPGGPDALRARDQLICGSYVARPGRTGSVPASPTGMHFSVMRARARPEPVRGVVRRRSTWWRHAGGSCASGSTRCVVDDFAQGSCGGELAHLRQEVFRMTIDPRCQQARRLHSRPSRSPRTWSPSFHQHRRRRPSRTVKHGCADGS